MRPRILIVEDEDSIRFAMRDYLDRAGYEVHCAGHLAEARRLLGDGRYAAVIADLRLTGTQGSEGLEIVSHVRDLHPGTRTLILTAYGSARLEREARLLGADAFLHKPTPLAEVRRVLATLLESPSHAL